MHTVVLVHGFLVGPSSMRLLAHRLKRQGFEPRLWGYDTRRTPVDQAAEALWQAHRHSPADQISWVGHSLGGRVILDMLARHPFDALTPALQSLVLLGTPIRPPQAAQALAQWRWGRGLLGQAAQALSESAPQPPEDVLTTVIAGTRSLGLGRCLESLPNPNDGTVACAETRLPGSQWLSLPVSHSGLLFSKTVAHATAQALAGIRLGETLPDGLATARP